MIASLTSASKADSRSNPAVRQPVIIPFFGWVATWDGTIPWVDLSRAGEIEEDINKNIKEKTLVIPLPFSSKHCGYIDFI